MGLRRPGTGMGLRRPGWNGFEETWYWNGLEASDARGIMQSCHILKVVLFYFILRFFHHIFCVCVCVCYVYVCECVKELDNS